MVSMGNRRRSNQKRYGKVLYVIVSDQVIRIENILIFRHTNFELYKTFLFKTVTKGAQGTMNAQFIHLGTGTSTQRLLYCL